MIELDNYSDLVFSAHAEVVPLRCIRGDANKSILRARGGSSYRPKSPHQPAAYSPRTRR